MRKVIDISGDGPNNSGTAVHLTRQAVVRRGITINGLPIMVRPGDGYYDVLDLHVYYENCVIGGPGAFLLTIKALDQFAEAIRRKLVLEIAGRMPEMIPVTASQAQDDYDCLIGEKLRLQRSPGP